MSKTYEISLRLRIKDANEPDPKSLREYMAMKQAHRDWEKGIEKMLFNALSDLGDVVQELEVRSICLCEPLRR